MGRRKQADHSALLRQILFRKRKQGEVFFSFHMPLAQTGWLGYRTHVHHGRLLGNKMLVLLNLRDNTGCIPFS